jgi:hypothetical protein
MATAAAFFEPRPLVVEAGAAPVQRREPYPIFLADQPWRSRGLARGRRAILAPKY